MLHSALFAAVLVVAIWMGWWNSGPLGSAKLANGMEVIFERYTTGTIHEFGRRDLRKVFKWVPAAFWNLCGYQPRVHAIHKEADPCTILWVRVRWNTARVAPRSSHLHVQAIEGDGTAYSWRRCEVYPSGPNGLVMPYRADSLPPPGGRLAVRFTEANFAIDPAPYRNTATLSLPNPNRVKPPHPSPLPLPQVQEHDGLRATLTTIRTRAQREHEFTIESEVELLWEGERLPNAFRHSWSVGPPGGARGEPTPLSVFFDHVSEDRVKADQIPRPPMRGHDSWILHLNVVSTAEFTELAEERGIPLFTTPVAAQRKGGQRSPEPKVSPEATVAGLGIADTWPPEFLRLVVRQAPAPWFPVGWKQSDPLPFVVVAEADGKRVVLRSPAAGGGYGPYGLASYDFGENQVAQELAYGKHWESKFEKIPVSERPPLPATIEYRLIPRRYWKFEFVVAPIDPPAPASAEKIPPPQTPKN